MKSQKLPWWVRSDDFEFLSAPSSESFFLPENLEKILIRNARDVLELMILDPENDIDEISSEMKMFLEDFDFVLRQYGPDFKIFS